MPTAESTDSGWWPVAKLVNPPPEERLHTVLQWILEQLNSGAFRFIGDGETPPAHTLLLGRGAADYETAELAVEEAQRRSRSVTVAGLFAKCRERGIEPEHSALADQAQLQMNANGRMNTEFHYAFQLAGILGRISEHTFVFDAPPIVGRAPRHTLDVLQEATRCYLFGLSRACVAACRTVLEDSLEQRVPRHQLLQESMQGGADGPLFHLINAAVRLGVLRKDLQGKAHQIRQKGNDVLHKPERELGDPWPLLLDTRLIVDELFAGL